MPGEFDRYNMRRLVSFMANVQGEDLGRAAAKIRRAIVHLHERLLGRDDAVDSAEVTRTFKLFSGIVGDAAGRKGIEKTENYTCRQGLTVPDPNYTIRAWRAVLTYLLRQQEFLYE